MAGYATTAPAASVVVMNKPTKNHKSLRERRTGYVGRLTERRGSAFRLAIAAPIGGCDHTNGDAVGAGGGVGAGRGGSVRGGGAAGATLRCCTGDAADRGATMGGAMTGGAGVADRITMVGAAETAGIWMA